MADRTTTTLTPQEVSEELEALKLARAEDAKKTEIMQQMLDQILPAMQTLRDGQHLNWMQLYLLASQSFTRMQDQADIRDLAPVLAKRNVAIRALLVRANQYASDMQKTERA